LEAAMKRALLLLLVVTACSGKSKMQSDWDELTDTQRTLVCELYRTHPEADFSGAAVDLGWELGTMMRFLERHC
jgi:hypothetical protein